ncbi:putative cysteine-rich receptor-like protein kinase 20 [Hordeum vulgare subsp. vulgare]|uniref:Resistance protein n=1 Tax=Hordeum vulgare subsp. vulgare TaxID=112509 RepID=Q2L855_HORVV|nr:putative cysteine-rich receptor-like protein kinase 20 [Hordeum vulgare subsp. vulgare]ABC73058.1 resistance protein [Hordeum vulgare subsp. vulgare]ABF18541.1 serine/threonine kinase-like protein ABC1037 [Hordeum vulgare subsp. vulgare]
MAAARKKIVVKVELKDDSQCRKALKALSALRGIHVISANPRHGNITVVGEVNPEDVLARLQKKLFPNAQIVAVGPVMETNEVTFEFVNRITNNFSEERIIGRGGHGVVFKGLQDNGECIAVKKFHLMQGLDNEEFKNEFNNLMRVQHQNTIRLVGYCHHTAQVPVERNGEHISARVEERALCSEYLPGGSLDRHLSNESCALDWHICYNIIKGLCEGLHYLHEGFGYPIYHLGLKPSKILLDKDMMPKIGGFGFSRHSTETFNTSDVTGTSVYMPPEYISTRQITPKFDVFSLGVIILQIMAGKQSYIKCADIPPEEFIELVYELWVNRLQATISKRTSREVRTCIRIALKCVEFNLMKRPTTNEIIQELNKIDIVEWSFEFLERITNGFSEQNIVGRGGYGVIYKGVLENGEEIAVKKLHPVLWIDDEQFKNELNILTRVKHKNIVQLAGYCHHTSQIVAEYKGEHVSASVVERAICLEYMHGGSLADQLSAEACTLDWDKCYKIIKEICEGLHYLHNVDAPIFHLDLKPANVLLDKDMVAKLCDFGLSRLFDSMQTYITESQDMKGTRGYMPPEYINRQQISPKFDVFSLGVIIIQIMAGKDGYFNCADTHPKVFIKHVCENWRMRMEANMPSHVSQVRTCIKIALKCVEDDRTRRPTIAQIVNELSNIGIPKSKPIRQWANKLTSLKTFLT